jgi:succinate dehydrogenase / fumarate reductase iron-sulfur subunit
MQVSVYRYNPDLDEVPVMRDVEVELPEGRDLMVLDVLHLMKDEDPTLSFRRSCREGVCGSDGINMNGKNGLACITPVSEVVKRNKLVLRPLPGLPVVRDLVVDMAQFYNQYAKVQPYLVNKEAPPAQERLQSPEEREKLDGLYECILCACCSTFLPVFLVESGQVHRSSWAVASLPFPGGLAGYCHRRAASQFRRPVQRVPLPRHHELRQRLP